MDIETLRGAMAADDERLRSAATRAGVAYMGCDTAAALADEIERLRLLSANGVSIQCETAMRERDCVQRELVAYKQALQDELASEGKLARECALGDETGDWEKHRYAIACLRNAMKIAANAEVELPPKAVSSDA